MTVSDKTAKAVTAVEATTVTVVADAVPVLDAVTAAIQGAADDAGVQATISQVTPKIPAKARSVLYTIGIWLGVAVTLAAPVVAVLTGDVKTLAVSIVGVGQALTSLLAKANLSKTATDLVAEQPTPAVG